MVRSLVTLLFLCVSAGWLPAANLAWMEDFDAALERAGKLNKPLLIHFYANWCIPCKKLDRVVFSDTTLADSIGKDYIPLKVDLELHPQLAKRFGVTIIPADVVLTPKGEVIANERSPSNVEGYSRRLTDLAAKQQAAIQPPVVDPPSVVSSKPETAGTGSFFADSLGGNAAQPVAAKPRSIVR